MKRAIAAAVLVASIALPATRAVASPPAAHNGDVVRAWNGVALDTVRRNSAGDAQAARLYAMVNAAIFDAVNGLQPTSRQRTAAIVEPEAGTNGDERAAAAAAAHGVLTALYGADAGYFDAQLAHDLASVHAPGQAKHGRAWGERVANGVVAARANDGSSPPETQPGSSAIGEFSAPWPGAQFRRLAPFVIADSAVYVGTSKPALTSAAYAAAFNEVKTVGNLAIPDDDARDTYRFWALGGGTTQPPGAWVQVAQAVSAAESLSLVDTARLFALETIAMVDTVAPTFATKYLHHFWRPNSAINRADFDGNPDTIADPLWKPRAGTNGSSPEHWSGHSSFSSSAAAVLAAFFGDDTSFTLTTDQATPETRHYDSFSDAAREAGRSRVLGGIHFEFSNVAGLEAGRAIASEVLGRALL